ncbi:S8 family peptidase [Granulicella sp. L60]|uniref:S8 family peptidase n=1 Tax=Granulicella sp. L60 TaxID=1641866 RepID=UPI00131D44F4|nr:S8 family peptidase [Granulicella sp. L60]
MDEVIENHTRLRAEYVNPALIVRVRTSGVVSDEEWTRAGLTVLGHDENNALVLFDRDSDLAAFTTRLDAYAAGPRAGRQHPSYNALIASIDEFSPLRPEDRIGSGLREEGFDRIDTFAEDRGFVLDIELWDFASQTEREAHALRFAEEIAARGGEVTDQYIGVTFTALRVNAPGRVIRYLLQEPVVRVVDLPPQVDLDVATLLETTVDNLGNVEPPDEDAPIVAILDTGVNDAHPLLAGIVVAKTSEPETLGLNDIYGHGTRVSGIAAYGDIRDCLENGVFQAVARIASGKVVNDQGNLDDRRLIASQVSEVVRRLHGIGCRIFNLSIGDRNAQYGGTKVGQWTAILDELARELDILFVVSAGNYAHLPTNHPEEHHTNYPAYLMAGRNRIYEPATAANALTVGAVAHAAAVRNDGPGYVSTRPIADVGEPAPFTCVGPGVNRGIKPELCDDGGNKLYDGLVQGLIPMPESEIITTHHQYLDHLFTSAVGTSYAAPLVAHKAAMVLHAFPLASANLLRALLVSSAEVPEPSLTRLQGISAETLSHVCGYGIANPVTAATSDTNRVVLFAESQMAMDHLFVYEVPIPADFAETKGRRQIRVTLAFDPPTRHSRSDYLGVEMSFRLVRGKALDWVREHYRKRTEAEGDYPKLGGRYDCPFDIGPTIRERGTLQRGTFVMDRNPAAEYGETYYLVVRCERQWFPDEYAEQRFAVVVEMAHEAEIRLYERIQERVTVRVRA